MMHASKSTDVSRGVRVPAWQSLRVPLLLGPHRGLRWLPFSGGKIGRLLLGRYEPDQTAQFLNYLRSGDVLFDVGAAVGYYTLLAARLVGSEGRVMAFEPDGKNAAFLSKHVAINRLSNVVIHRSAVGNRTGSATFAAGTGTGTGHLSETGTTTVPICKLDEFVREGPFPTHLKIDVEGAELEVLEGARRILSSVRPTLFLSTHGPAIRQACCQYLRKLGYHTRSMSSNPKYELEILCAPGPLSGPAASVSVRNAA